MAATNRSPHISVSAYWRTRYDQVWEYWRQHCARHKDDPQVRVPCPCCEEFRYIDTTYARQAVKYGPQLCKSCAAKVREIAGYGDDKIHDVHTASEIAEYLRRKS